MKIAICHVNLALGFRGGERQTLFLIEECLNSNFYEVFAVVRRNSDLSKRLNKFTHLRLVEVESRVCGHFTSALRQCSLFHAHEAKAAHWAYLQFLVTQTPYIITRRVMHNLNKNKFTRSAYKNAKATIGNCKWIVDSLVAYGLDTPHLVPSTSNFMPRIVTPQATTSRIRLLHAGALVDHHKGQSTAIRAIANLPDKFILEIVGDGPDYNRLRELAVNLGVQDRVSFSAWAEDLNYIPGAYDVFLMTSNHEGAGSLLIDIMRCKVPIIATRVGGIPDLIEPGVTGHLIEPGDSNALSVILKAFVDHPDPFLSLAENAYKKSLSYTPVEMFSAYHSIYKSINQYTTRNSEL